MAAVYCFARKKQSVKKKKIIGKVQKGVSGNVTVITGIMNTGEASGIPIIKNLLKKVLR